jgi:hypothetical protein
VAKARPFEVRGALTTSTRLALLYHLLMPERVAKKWWYGLLAIPALLFLFLDAAEIGQWTVRKFTTAEPPVAAELLTQRWVDHPVGSRLMLFVPWPLEPAETSLSRELAASVEEATTRTLARDGITILTRYFRFRPGTPVNLEAGADGAIANMKATYGADSVEGSKKKVSFLDEPAFEIDVLVQRGAQEPLRVRAFLTGNGPHSEMLFLAYRDDQPRGALVWKRLREGMRLRHTVALHAEGAQLVSD